MSADLRSACAALTLVALGACATKVDDSTSLRPSGFAEHAAMVQHNRACLVYPAESALLKESGIVVVKTLVDPDGLPKQVRVERSSGFERLDEAAVETVKCYQFKPGTANGLPTSMWLHVPLRFEPAPATWESR